METLAFALEYVQQGFSIFPLKPGSKIPLLVSWEPFQRTHASKGLIEEWFSNGHAENNIAIITGKISRIIAFDIDGEEAMAYFDRAVEPLDDEGLKTALRDTLHIRTGSGNTNVVIGFRQEEFVLEQAKITNAVLWKSEKKEDAKHNEVRLKGEGGYIVAPPSIHPNGNRYEIINDTRITVITLSKTQIRKLISAIENQAEDYSPKNDSEIKLHEEDIRHMVSVLKPYYKHGDRNDFTMCLSGWMRKEGVGLKSAFKVIELIAADDEEKPARIRTLEETYKKQDLHKVCGYSGLLSTLVNQIQNEDKAKQILDSVFPKTQERKQIKGVVAAEDKSQSQTIIELAYENTSLFFKDQHGTAFALVAPTKAHREIIALESTKFKRYLHKLFYDNNNKKVANIESINNAIHILQANIEYSDTTIPLHLRVAWKKEGNTIYYDLTDEKWRYVEITKDGWEIREDNSSILFARYNQVAQVLPNRNYEQDILDKFIGLTNVKDENDKLLLKVYIISLFIPDIAHAMLIVHGEKGGAKTLLKHLIKQLVDPSRPTLLTIHTSRDEFVQQLSHNYVAYYDNLRTVPKWLPDEACKAVTGIGQTKRKLYTNDEDIVYEYKRCLGFSGINICMTEPDALDRSLLIELTRIPRNKVKLESQILSEFEQLKPGILGYILDVLVKALQVRPNLQLNDLPRMADFALWGEAISQAMGKDSLEFLKAYYENIGRQNIEAIEANPLGQAITKFFEELENKAWEGSPGILLARLNKVAETNNIDTTQKIWPKATNSLTKRIKQIQSNLLEGIGIKITISRDNKKNTSTVRIEKEPPLPPEPPDDKNQAQKQVQNTGGTLVPGGSTSDGKRTSSR